MAFSAQLVALAADRRHPLSQAALVLLGRRVEGPQLGGELLPQRGHQLGREDLALPLGGDGILDLFEWQIRQIAARPASVPAGAEEVLIALAAAAGGDAEQQAGIAAGAVQAAR